MEKEDQPINIFLSKCLKQFLPDDFPSPHDLGGLGDVGANHYFMHFIRCFLAGFLTLVEAVFCVVFSANENHGSGKGGGGHVGYCAVPGVEGGKSL